MSTTLPEQEVAEVQNTTARPASKAGCQVSRCTIFGLAGAHIVTVGLAIAAVLLALQSSRDFVVGDDDVLLHKKDHSPLSVQEHLSFLNLTQLHRMSFLAVQKPTSLVIKINKPEMDEMYRLYNVRAAEIAGKAPNTILTLYLAMGHRLEVTQANATLFDSAKEQLQTYDIREGQLEATPPSIDSTSSSALRQLKLKGMGMGYSGIGMGVVPVALPMMPVAVMPVMPMMPMMYTPTYAPAMSCGPCGLYYGGAKGGGFY